MTRNLLWCLFVVGSVLTTGVSAQPELDTTFNTTGIQTVSFGGYAKAADLAIQADNKIVMVGTCRPQTLFTPCVVRYNENGSLDLTFGGTGIVLTDITVASGVAVQSDGKIVMAGYRSMSINPSSDLLAVVRFNPNGTLDNSFGTNGRVLTGTNIAALNRASEVAIQPDGKILVVGTTSQEQFFPPVSLTPQGFVVRFLTDGSLDGTFASAGVFRISQTPSTWGSSAAVQPDGKVLIGGSFAENGGLGPVKNLLIRLNVNGSPDPTWDGDGVLAVDSTQGGGGSFGSLALQADGRVVAAGTNVVFRFNADGTFDSSFDGDGYRTSVFESGFTSQVMLSAGGRITVVGDAGDSFSIARFRPDGTPDTTFSGDGRLTMRHLDGTDDGGCVAGGIDSQGRIVAGGWAGDGQLANRFAVLRLRPSVMSAGISGRVTRTDGYPVVGAVLTIQDGNIVRVARSNPFGYYRFAGVLIGQTYTVAVQSKGLVFTDRAVFVGEQIVDFDFVSDELPRLSPVKP